MSIKPWIPSACAQTNGDFISIETYSGYGLMMADPDSPEYLLPPRASNEEIGKAVLAALSASRQIDPDDEKFFNNDKNDNDYKKWIEELMALYKYKTKRALFQKMISCDINLEKEIITIEPTYHEKLEAWDGKGITEKDYVRIPADSPPEEIGAALRLAFSRCTGPRPDDHLLVGG